MNHEQIREVVARIAYKPGWAVVVHADTLHTYEPAGEDRAPHMPGKPTGRQVLTERPYLQVRYDGSGAYGSDPWTGRKWMLSQHMTESEITYTAFNAIVAAEEHETRELFLYEGVAVCGPHASVRDIVDLVQSRKLTFDVRQDAMQGAE